MREIARVLYGEIVVDGRGFYLFPGWYKIDSDIMAYVYWTLNWNLSNISKYLQCIEDLKVNTSGKYYWCHVDYNLGDIIFFQILGHKMSQNFFHEIRRVAKILKRSWLAGYKFAKNFVQVKSTIEIFCMLSVELFVFL